MSIVQVCYSWWCLSALCILDRLHWNRRSHSFYLVLSGVGQASMAFTFHMVYAAKVCTVLQLCSCGIDCISAFRLCVCVLCTHSSERMLISLHSLGQKVVVACRINKMELSQIDQKTWLMHFIPFLALQHCLDGLQRPGTYRPCICIACQGDATNTPASEAMTA